jgi:hypothetical protein
MPSITSSMRIESIATGTFKFIVTATDSSSPAQTATASLSITIKA